MIKVTTKEFYVGMKFEIRNSWRKIIAAAEGVREDKYPFQFQIAEILQGSYMCKSVQNKKSDKIYKIEVNDDILKYLFGTEVNDCNVGLYINDYIPFENKRLILTDPKDLLDILPVKIELSATKVQCDNSSDNSSDNNSDSKYSSDSKVVVAFIYRSLILDKTYTLKSHAKDSWKLIDDSDEYMTDVEKMFQDTFIHKGYVFCIGNKFATYLESKGQEKDAIEIRARVKVHDNSKILNKDEFRALTRIINDKKSLKNANSRLSMYSQDAVELHWKNNDHHPEHYEDLCEMSRCARQEMAIDFCARSLQYGTDLIDFVEKRQKDRFHFPEQMYNEVLGYCKVLNELVTIGKNS